MSRTAISANNLGKRYALGEPVSEYPTLKDTLTAAARRAGSAIRSPMHALRGRQRDYFWALRGVSLDVTEGEVIGIIGSNGAGKSTLLKVLSRITEPTEGSAALYGRVGSLLEVGTGFHPELSGRENIFLNGAILGMQRREIATKFDEIVAFAEVDRFIDMPVKRYSSGMYLRLAFAVAAHLEPEILIIDEVLAVGDVAFQKKCLGKMGEVASQGRTVLFVSHNMDAVQRLCTRAVLLEKGGIVQDGDVPRVIARYLSRAAAGEPARWTPVDAADRTGTGEARFTAVRYSSGNESVGHHAYPLGPLTVELQITAQAPLTVESLSVILWSSGGVKLLNTDTISSGTRIRLQSGANRVTLRIVELYLNPGTYRLGLWLADGDGSAYDYIESAANLEVLPALTDGPGMTPKDNGFVPCRFEVFAGDERVKSAP